MEGIAASPARQTENALLLGQNRILEMVATGAPLADTLTELVQLIEAQEPGMRCGILVVTDDGAHLRRGCGPNLPESYHAALDGVPIAPPYVGACGAAAHQGIPVVVPDIANDARWSDQWRDLVLSCGLRAVRSTPVHGSDGRVLASFAMYYDQPRDPHPAHPQLIETAAHLAGIALERKRSEEALRESEARLAAELAAMRQLQDLSILLIQEGDADALYRHVLDAAIAVMRSDMASMQMFHENRGELRLLAWRGSHPASAAFWERVSVGSEAPCGEALRSGRRVVVPDIEACASITGAPDIEAFRRSGIRAVQSTPLVSRSGRLLGMISTHWRAPHEPADRDLRLLDVLARQAADLIERAQAEAALRESERRFREVVEALPAAIYTTDAAGRITLYSPAAVDLWGQRPTLGASTWCGSWRLHWPDGRPMPHDQCPMAVALKENRPIHGAEAVAERPDGTRVPFLAYPTPLHDETGALVGAVNMLVDITDRKAAEEALREREARLLLLAHEVDHRAKNMLASVQAIARMTRSDTVPDFRDALLGRLSALTRAHAVLAESRWTGADLRHMVEEELAAYRTGDAGRVSVAGPGVALCAVAAQALSMALHELATNAVKYGALSASGGRVAVAWDWDAEDRLVLHWAEAGGPAVRTPSRRGFGSSLIEGAVSGQLGGTIHRDWPAEGLSCRMTIPRQALTDGMGAPNGQERPIIPKQR